MMPRRAIRAVLVRFPASCRSRLAGSSELAISLSGLPSLLLVLGLNTEYEIMETASILVEVVSFSLLSTHCKSGTKFPCSNLS